MGLRATDVVPHCPKCGDNVSSVEIGGVRFCSDCLVSVLGNLGVHTVVMRRVEHVTPDATIVCRCCGGQRIDDDCSCPICGVAPP